MKLIVEIDGKAALPVRAIPYASGDPGELIHPGMVPQILAGAAGDPENPDEIPRAFRVSLSGFDRAEPGFWSLYRENIRQLKKQRETNGLGSVEYFRSCLQLLPSDIFVWFDEFNEWQGRTLAWVLYNPTYYPREKRIDGWSLGDDPVAVRRPPLRAEAFVPTEFEQLVTEGIQSLARGRLANVEAECTDNLALPTREETSPSAESARKRLRDYVQDAVARICAYERPDGTRIDCSNMPGAAGDLLWVMERLHPERFEGMQRKAFREHYKRICKWPHHASSQPGARSLYLEIFPELKHNPAPVVKIHK